MLTNILVLVEIEKISTPSNYIIMWVVTGIFRLKLKQQLVMGYNELVGSLLKSVKVSWPLSDLKLIIGWFCLLNKWS